jgi:hypothetical protein
LLEHFDGALGVALIEHCKSAGMSELQDIAYVVLNPHKRLDPIDRLEEYRHSFLKERGSESERFGKWIGRALDPPHYPLLELIGGEIGVPLVHLVNEVLSNVLSA